MFSQQKKIQNFDLKLNKKAMEEQKIMVNEGKYEDKIEIYVSNDEGEAQIKKKKDGKRGIQIKKMHIPCSRTNAKKPKKKIDATHLKDMCNEGKSLGFQLIDCKTQSCQSPKRERNVNQSLKNLSYRVKQLVGQLKNTTYNILSDRILKEVSVCSDENQNLKRRVYDSINVMIAMGVFVKNKKIIQPGPAFYNDIHGDKIIDNLDKQRVFLNTKFFFIQNILSVSVQKKKAKFLMMKEREIFIDQLLKRNKYLFSPIFFLSKKKNRIRGDFSGYIVNTKTLFSNCHVQSIVREGIDANLYYQTYVDSQTNEVRVFCKDQIKMFGDIDMVVHLQSLKDSIYKY